MRRERGRRAAWSAIARYRAVTDLVRLYPFTRTWRPSQALAAEEELDKLGADERPRAAAFIADLKAEPALMVLRGLTGFPQEAREKMFKSAEAGSEDGRLRAQLSALDVSPKVLSSTDSILEWRGDLESRRLRVIRGRM